MHIWRSFFSQVLRASNVVTQLQKERPLLTDEDIDSCKNGSNTWAFVGDVNDKPQLSCVFQSDEAQNEFLSDPKVGLGEDVYDRGGQIIGGTNTNAKGGKGGGKDVQSGMQQEGQGQRQTQKEIVAGRTSKTFKNKGKKVRDV